MGRERAVTACGRHRTVRDRLDLRKEKDADTGDKVVEKDRGKGVACPWFQGFSSWPVTTRSRACQDSVVRDPGRVRAVLLYNTNLTLALARQQRHPRRMCGQGPRKEELFVVSKLLLTEKKGMNEFTRFGSRGQIFFMVDGGLDEGRCHCRCISCLLLIILDNLACIINLNKGVQTCSM